MEKTKEEDYGRQKESNSKNSSPQNQRWRHLCLQYLGGKGMSKKEITIKGTKAQLDQLMFVYNSMLPHNTMKSYIKK